MQAKVALSSWVLMIAMACSGSVFGKDKYAVDMSRSVMDESAIVALMSAEEFEDNYRSASANPQALRNKLKKRTQRSLAITQEDGSSPVQASLASFNDGQTLVLCVLGPKLPTSQTLYVSIWNRSAQGTGPNFTDFQKLYPANELQAKKVSNDELFCIGQQGSGLRVKATYDKEGASEQVYAHFTARQEDQMEQDDVVVLGKNRGDNSRSPSGQYWPAISVYNVTK